MNFNDKGVLHVHVYTGILSMMCTSSKKINMTGTGYIFNLLLICVAGYAFGTVI